MRNMRLYGICRLFVVLTVLCAGCASTPAQKPKLRSILEKNASFGLERMPIGFWNYLGAGWQQEHINESEVQDWADAGFTVTHGPDFNADNPKETALMTNLLGWCAQRDIKLILHDRRLRGEKLSEALGNFDGHPAVFGFFVADEPIKRWNAGACRVARRIGQNSTNLHAFINMGRYMKGVEEWAGYTNRADYLDMMAKDGDLDFYCYDCYEQMQPGKEGWHQHFENLRLHREASRRNGIPFWVTMLSAGHFNFECPNYNDLRWQFNTAVCSGASGVLWFFYYMRDPHSNYRSPPVDEFWEKTRTYYDLKKVHNSFHRKYGDLFLRLVPTRVTFYPKAYGGGKVWKPNELLSDIWAYNKKREFMIGEFVDIEGRRYVMIVNNSRTENVHVVLTFEGTDTKIYSYGWDGREHEGPDRAVFGAEWRDKKYVAGYWLAPGQEIVQRVEAKHLENSVNLQEKDEGGDLKPE